MVFRTLHHGNPTAAASRCTIATSLSRKSCRGKILMTRAMMCVFSQFVGGRSYCESSCNGSVCLVVLQLVPTDPIHVLSAPVKHLWLQTNCLRYVNKDAILVKLTTRVAAAIRNINRLTLLSSAPDKDSYYHEKFVQNQPLLAHEIKRTAVKGQGPRRCQALCDEPNFYLQPSASDGTKSTSATSSTASTLVPTKGLLAPPSLSILPGANRPENPGHGLDATTHLATFDSVGTFRLGGNLETQLWRHVQEQRARNDQLALLLALQSNTSNNNSESLPYQPPFSFQLLSPPPSNSTSMLQAHVNAIENVRARARLGNL
jgi:hypothetical protein